MKSQLPFCRDIVFWLQYTENSMHCIWPRNVNSCTATVGVKGLQESLANAR